MEKQTNIDKAMPQQSNDHFKLIFWFICAITLFGAFLTIYIITIYPKELSSRFADTGLIFWLSTAVSGGIGYLIGSSAQQRSVTPASPGKVTADISATVSSEPKDT
jgi:hypothetical protein